MKLLLRNDDASPTVWNLVRMLATNQSLYKDVLSLENAKVDGKIVWKNFFDNDSVYKQIYTFEIIEAFMEQSENKMTGAKRVSFVEYQDKSLNLPNIIPKSGSESHADSGIDVSETNNWTSMFFENGGFQYVLESFVSRDSQSAGEHQFEIKKTAFMLTLLRFFLTAAYSVESDSNIYTAVKLARKSSSVRDDEEKKEEDDGKLFEHMKTLIEGEQGQEMLKKIDYSKLQSILVSMIANTVTKESFLLEDKLVVENSLNLWIGLILNKPALFADFLSYSGKITSKQVVLTGLLYCPEEKIRDDFK